MTDETEILSVTFRPRPVGEGSSDRYFHTDRLQPTTIHALNAGQFIAYYHLSRRHSTACSVNAAACFGGQAAQLLRRTYSGQHIVREPISPDPPARVLKWRLFKTGDFYIQWNTLPGDHEVRCGYEVLR